MPSACAVKLTGDAMAEHRRRDGGDILGRDVELPVEDRAGLAGQHQIDARARTRAPAHPLADEVGRLSPLPRTRGAHQLRFA